MSMTLSAPLADPLAAPAPEAAPTAATSCVASLESAVKRYGRTEALRGLDLTLRRGEVVALLGPNGAGKTTAVRLLLGLISPDEGRVRVLGRDPRTAAARTRIGAMLQVARVPEALLVRSSLPSVISLRRDREAVVIHAERPEEVVRRLLLEDDALHGLEVAAAPLEDAFLALTGGNTAA